MTKPRPTETPVEAVAVFAAIDRIDEARQESRAYYLTRGDDLPADIMLTDEVRDAGGQLIGYSCELLLSAADADHIMRYYADQFVDGHVPAQTLERRPLDDVLSTKAATCAKHQQRKQNRAARKQKRDAAERVLKQRAAEKRRQRRKGRRRG